MYIDPFSSQNPFSSQKSAGYCIIDPKDHTVHWCDEEFLEFAGKERDEVIGSPIHGLVKKVRTPDEPLEEWRDGDSKLFIREEDGARYFCRVFLKGKERWIHLNFRKVDTEQESGLDPFHEIFYEVSPDILVMGDLREQRFLRVNPSFYRLLGYSEEETLNSDFFELCHPDDRETLKRSLELIAQGHPMEGVSMRGLKKEGGTKWIEWSGFADSFNQTFYAVGRDVDQEVKVKQELVEREHWYYSLFESSPVAKIIHDGDVVVDLNQEVLNLMGEKDKGLFLYGHPEDFFPLQRRRAFRERIRKVLKEGKPFISFSTSVKRNDGTYLDIEIDGGPVRYEGSPCVHLVIRDVSARREAEKKLERREAEYRTIVEGMPEGVFMLAPEDQEGSNMRFEFANHRFLEDRGVEREDIIGKGIFRVLREYDVEGLLRKLRTAFLEKRMVEYEFRLELDEGVKTFSERVIPFLNEEGVCIRLIGMSRDVTEEKRVEGELERLALITKETENGIMITDPDGLTEWINDGMIRLTGYELDDLKGRKPGELLQGAETDPKEIEKMSRAIENQEQVTVELLNYKKNGSPFWVRVHIQPIFGEGGRLQGFFSIQTDMTERRLMEDRLRSSEKQFRQLVENMNEGILSVDENYNVRYVNDFLLDRMGLRREEVEKENLIEFMKKHAPEYKEPLEEVYEERKEGKEGQDEYYLKNHKTGEAVPFLVSGNPLFDEEGNFVGDIAIFTDLSERKELERKVLNAVIQTQESERKRFAEDLHDGIGQILSGVKMQLQSLEGEADNEVVSDVRNMIEQAIEETRTITHDLMPNELRDFGLIKAVENLIQRMWKSHGIHVEFNAPEEELELPEELQVAAYRIFQELLNNVLKHSKAENVTFRIEKKKSSLEFLVEDDGIGFDPKPPKEGVGTTNIKRRADLFGGSVNIRSKPGKGTQVEGRIPLKGQGAG